ncbi:MAG: glycosyltransferase family 2 protein [Pseudomonadota bacterium]
MTEAPHSAKSHVARNWAAYRMRWKRRRLLWRSWRSRHQLTNLTDRTDRTPRDGVVVVMTVRNEMTRLAHFLQYYRDLGVAHFLIVDNDSDDGTGAFLAEQADVSLWHSAYSYRAARFGVDWTTWLQMTFCAGRWTLVVDADELMVFAHHDTRDLPALTQFLDQQNRDVFGCLMLDLYPRDAVGVQRFEPGGNPLDVLNWFDPGPYRARRQHPVQNLWVQGGARERVFFGDDPDRSPTLNKIPLVKWRRSFAYVNSSHSALPPRLNHGYDGPGDPAPCGVLLHTKFLPEVVDKAREDKIRGQHFHTPKDFVPYYDSVIKGPQMHGAHSVRYEGWRQLEDLGLLSSGGWT